MADYKLFCLGRPNLELDGLPVKLEMRKSLALLVYLRMGDRDYSREYLAALFWPEFDQQHAQANLRRVLSSLKTSLSIQILEADREKVGLLDRSLLWFDVDEFHQRLAAGGCRSQQEGKPHHKPLHALEEAIQLYKGDFLEGFNLGDCPDFDEWQFLQRESLRLELAQALQQITEGYIAQGQWEPAIAHAHRWLNLDRLNEPAQRFLISLYAQAGQRNTALRQYEELERLLKEELDQPEWETTELYRKIRKGAPDRSQEVPSLPFQEAPARSLAEPLLKTKLYLPSGRGPKVVRERIHRLLNRIEEHALTILSAPAGFGKTTALTEWAAQSSLPVAWISLDSADNDPVRFVSYLVAALENVCPGVGSRSNELLLSSQSIPIQAVLTSLIHALERISTPYVLVLDDYQFIDAAPIHEALQFLLEHMPVEMHLVIATRADPPLPLARLRTRGSLLEIRTHQLRFATGEAAEYLNQLMKLGLSQSEIDTLQARTEGWIAGLQMAAISLQGRPDASEFIQAFSGSNRYILDYLVNEVLVRQPEPIQAFLLQTSILERLSGPLCEALLVGRLECFKVDNSQFLKSFPPSSLPTCQRILEYLERANLFVYPLDDERRWYRYHHLFADLLRARLEQIYPDRIEKLNQLAAGWYEANGSIPEAVQHSLAGKDYDRAAGLIEKISGSILQEGGFTTVQAWIQALPEGIVHSRPRLCLSYATALLQFGTTEKVEGFIKAAKGWLEAQKALDPGERSTSLSEISEEIDILEILICTLAQNPYHTIDLTLSLVERLPEFTPDHQAHLLWVLGNAYYLTSELSKAESILKESLRIAQASGFLFIELVAANRLACIHQVYGRMHRAYEFYQKALQSAVKQGKAKFQGMGFIYPGMSNILREWNCLEEARQILAEGLKINEAYGIPNYLVNGFYFLARLLLARGDLDEAQAALEKASLLIRRYPINLEFSALHTACQVRVWLAKGKQNRAAEWVRMAQADGPDPSPLLRELSDMARARLLIAKGSLEEATCLLAEVAEEAESAGWFGRLIEILALQALALQGQCRVGEALAVLEKCLALGEPEGYVRVFIDEGEPMKALLTTGLEQGRWSETRLLAYAHRLLDAFLDASLDAFIDAFIEAS